jgi:hypothetical protein
MATVAVVVIMFFRVRILCIGTFAWHTWARVQFYSRSAVVGK